MWEPRRLTTLWAFMACYRDSFTFFLTVQYLATTTNYDAHVTFSPSSPLILPRTLFSNTLHLYYFLRTTDKASQPGQNKILVSCTITFLNKGQDSFFGVASRRRQ
jgi:hypothetical protein